MQSTNSMNLIIQNQRKERRLPVTISSWAASLLLFLISALPVHAQFGASLSGTVTDSSEAVIPNATVTLTNPSTSEQRTTVTGDSGFYKFSELPVGDYSVKVTANGFKDETYTDVAVSAELPRTLDIKLSIGQAAES